MLSKDKIELIHVAKAKLKLSDENYEAILSGFGVDSSKDLDADGFRELMNVFRGLGFVSSAYRTRRNMRVKSALAGDHRGIASNAQIGMIRGLWQERARCPDDYALEKFVFRITKKISLNVLSHRDIERLKTAIENMEEKG